MTIHHEVSLSCRICWYSPLCEIPILCSYMRKWSNFLFSLFIISAGCTDFPSRSTSNRSRCSLGAVLLFFFCSDFNERLDPVRVKRWDLLLPRREFPDLVVDLSGDSSDTTAAGVVSSVVFVVATVFCCSLEEFSRAASGWDRCDGLVLGRSEEFLADRSEKLLEEEDFATDRRFSDGCDFSTVCDCSVAFDFSAVCDFSVATS